MLGLVCRATCTHHSAGVALTEGCISAEHDIFAEDTQQKGLRLSFFASVQGLYQL